MNCLLVRFKIYHNIAQILMLYHCGVSNHLLYLCNCSESCWNALPLIPGVILIIVLGFGRDWTFFLAILYMQYRPDNFFYILCTYIQADEHSQTQLGYNLSCFVVLNEHNSNSANHYTSSIVHFISVNCNFTSQFLHSFI